MSQDSSINDERVQDLYEVKYDNGEPIEHIVTIEGDKVPLHKVLHAYAGLARPGTYYAPSRSLPSMAPTGLIGFGTAATILGFYLLQARGIIVPNMFICSGYFAGGVGLVTAGIWEFFLENSHGVTVSGCYGFYWLAMSALYTPSFGMQQRFVEYCEKHASEMPTKYPSIEVWAVETMMHSFGAFTLATSCLGLLVVSTLLKSTLAFLTCLTFVMFILVMSTAGYWADNLNILKAAGVFSILAGLAAMYNGFAGIMIKENSYIHMKPILLSRGESLHDEEKRR